MGQLIKATEKLPAVKKPLKTKKFYTKKFGIWALAVIIILLVVSISLLGGGLKAGAKKLMASYSQAYESEKETTYGKFYQTAYERAEKKYHVSNTVIISIGNLEETGKLEVLKANDKEFIIEDKDSNTGNVTAWLEVSGEGTFVIDLQAAEYIIDNERRYVLVRIPKPELSDVSVTGSEKKFFKDDWQNGSYSEGVSLAMKQRNTALLRIRKSLLSNQYIYDNAKTVAVRMIQNLIRQFNPDIHDLTVEVEFME